LQVVAAVAGGPLPPLRELLRFREDEDCLLLLFGLLDGQLLGVLLAAEGQGRRQAAHREQSDEDGDRLEAPFLEVAISRVEASTRGHATATAGGQATPTDVVIVRWPLGCVHALLRSLRREDGRSLNGFGLAGIEHWCPPSRRALSGLRPWR